MSGWDIGKVSGCEKGGKVTMDDGMIPRTSMFNNMTQCAFTKG